MSTVVVVGIVVVAVIVIAVMAYIAYGKRRSKQLQDQFGPEYDRTVQDAGDKREAEDVLVERRKRVKDLHIVPLSAEEHQHFADQWQMVQSQFVDDPSGAIAHADELIAAVMKTRGYPVGDFEQRADDVSVDHPELVADYRQAHEIAQRNDAGNASTEDLRVGMIHYRSMFADLLETPQSADVQS